MLRTMLLSIVVLLLVFDLQVEARKMTDCQVVKELKGRVGSLILPFICLAKYEGEFDTKHIEHARGASLKYGIFQISSEKWCSVGRIGGLCKKRCEDFLDDDIQDDIKCAHKIVDTVGFKNWNKWMKNCAKPAGVLPSINHCNKNPLNPNKISRRPNINVIQV